MSKVPTAIVVNPKSAEEVLNVAVTKADRVATLYGGVEIRADPSIEEGVVLILNYKNELIGTIRNVKKGE